MTNDPAEALSLCLLANAPLTWEAEVVATRVGESATPLPPRESSQLFRLHHSDSEVVVYTGMPVDAASLERAGRQTWDWPLAREVVSRCAMSYLVADHHAKRLPWKERWRRLQRVVGALMETCPPGRCLALHSPSCQRLVEPEPFLESLRPEGDILCGAVNVRLFEVEDHGPDVRLMDTLGLAALGLPDLQCVFRGLDPNDVAALLWDYGYYLFEKGDVIKDGDVVKALRAGEHWTCGRQYSLTEPRRVVLDLYPGLEHDPQPRPT
jgi:hypothetical protein